MIYDDVDVSILDAKDTFGVAKSPTSVFKNSAISDDNEHSMSNKSTPRKSGPPWDIYGDSKIPAKQSKKNKPYTDTFFGNVTSNESNYNVFGSNNWTTSANAAGASGNTENRVVEKPHEIATTGDFRDKVAVTFQEKLSVVEERDRHLREDLRNENKNMNEIILGTCPDMCPEKERLLREIHCSFSSFEAQIVQNEMLVVPELLVKEYARSSADQDEPLPHELRPEPVLVDTMSHILTNIIPRIEEDGVDSGEWYHFCWDRLRSIRKDIVQQQLCSVRIATVLERSARFHICCAERMFDADRRVFDHKINTENLVNCLQMLINMYDDLAAQGIRCANENEFRVYMMLLLLNRGDVPDLLDRRDACVEEAAQIYFAFKLNLYAEFFRRVKQTSYLNACILQRYFGAIRAHILNVLVSAYSSGNQIPKFPVSFARKVLEFDDDDETIAYVAAHGFTAYYDPGGGGVSEIRCLKSSFVVPEQPPVCKSSYILRTKRTPMLAAIMAAANYTGTRRLGKVHSSFDEFDRLKEDARWADDQRKRVIELYGDVYANGADEEAPSDEPTDSDMSASDAQSLRSSSIYTVESTKPGSPSGSAVSANSAFAFNQSPKSMSKFNFGLVHPSPSPFSSCDLPSFPATDYEESVKPDDFGVRPLSAAANVAPPAEASASGAVLYDPEFATESDVDEIDAEVPTPQPVARNDNGAFPHLEPNVDHTSNVTPTKSPPDLASPVTKKSPPPPPVLVWRKSEEVVDRLTSALDVFQSLYYNKEIRAVPASVSQVSRNSPMRFTARKLRKLVKQRLKRNRVQKYARLWRKKAQLRKMRRDNFVGIVHLSPEEYFRLWGSVNANERLTTRNLVTEVLDTAKALRWSSALLGDDDASRSIPFAGADLANDIARAQSAQCHRSSVCCKLLVSLPHSRHDHHRTFACRVSKLVRTLYCKCEKGEAQLGSVWCTRTRGMKICISANVHGGLADARYTVGLCSAVLLACEKWEKFDELRARLESICCQRAYPVFVGVIVLGDDAASIAFSSAISALLSKLQKRNAISGYRTTVWKRWSSLCRAVTLGCARPLRTPPFRVRNLRAFVEQVGGDLFACLQCAYVNTGDGRPTAPASPVTFVRAYNECLKTAVRLVCMRHLCEFNLSDEFVEALTGVADARTNFSHAEDVTAAAVDFTLVGFTKWPPKSVRKMQSLLTAHCAQLDTSSNVLLANVLRLVCAGDCADATVEEISARAPWLQIAELWFRYRLQSVAPEKCRNLFVIYDEIEVKELVERMAVEQMY